MTNISLSSSSTVPPANYSQQVTEPAAIISLSWNLEGLKRNLICLRHFLDQNLYDFVFISEPNVFTSDLKNCMALFRGDYCWELNSEDRYDQDIALTKSRTTGGTMVMWKSSLDKYVQAHPVVSTSFLPVIFSPPGYPVSVHIALYLPTAGRDADYVEQLALLSNCIKELKFKYVGCAIFIRGDGNTNSNNKERVRMFSYFLSSHDLVEVNINHSTYHHFLGGGAFDSDVDVILQPENFPNQEIILGIFCSKDFPDMFSHHDAISSKLVLPCTPLSSGPDQELLVAPRVNITRSRITWSEQGITDYQAAVQEKLAEIRLRWLNPLSKTSLSVLLQTTYDVLTKAAAETNKSVNINNKKESKPKKIPTELKKSRSHLIKLRKIADAEGVKTARNEYKSLIRKFRAQEDINHNEKLMTILSTNPSSAYKTAYKTSC